MVLLGQKLLYSLKVVEFGQGCCIRAKLVVIGQKCLYLGKSGCVRAKMVLFRQKWFYSAKWLYLGKVVVFGQKLF